MRPSGTEQHATLAGLSYGKPLIGAVGTETGREVGAAAMGWAEVVEIRPADFPLVDGTLKAKVLAFDWWIANSDRTWADDAGNPNLLWCEQSKRLLVIDHNLAFSPSLRANFWKEHAFRDAGRSWSPAFCQSMSDSFRRALAELNDIWDELPDDWTEVDCDLTLSGITELLREFERDAEKFWSPL